MLNPRMGPATKEEEEEGRNNDSKVELSQIGCGTPEWAFGCPFRFPLTTQKGS